MRRQLADVLPLLSRHYGISPFDVDRLTFREVDAYLNDLARLRAQGDDDGV